LFKPAIDDLAGWIDRTLESAGNMKGALVSLKCAPPSSDQIDLVKSYVIGVLQNNVAPDQIATYMDATLGTESPAITSRCVLTINYAGRAQLGVYSEDLKGHVTALYGPDPLAWLKFTAAAQFKSIPETMPDFRLSRLEEGYEAPFIGGHDVFLPYAHAVWPEISALRIDDAINYLSLKRVQKRDDVEIFGFKIPFNIVVASSPILIVMLCINLHFSLGRATSEQLRTQLPLLRYGDRFPKLQYLFYLSLAIGLPAYALLYITYLLLTQVTETDSLSTLLAALKEAVDELDLPPAWEPIRAQAKGVVNSTLWTLLSAIVALTTIVVIGWQNARHLHVRGRAIKRP
jgi:hypothetical protein